MLNEDNAMKGQRVQDYRARGVCQDQKGRTRKGSLHLDRIETPRVHRWWESRQRQLVASLRRMTRSFRADEIKLAGRCPPTLDCPEAAGPHGEADCEHGSSESTIFRGRSGLTASIRTRVIKRGGEGRSCTG